MTFDNFLITLPPPTANGGLHMGHMSGPFLAADVFYKYQRLVGCSCASVTYSDENQSYVRVTAERQGCTPDELAAHWSRDILETLRLYGAAPDHYLRPDASSNEFVRQFFLRLYERGVLVRKSMPVLYSSEKGRCLDEAGIAGYCPRCLAACKCGICEACAFVNDADSLLMARDAVSGFAGLERRSVDLMVIETERFREGLAEFYRRNRRFRPRYLWLAEDALGERLPDFPVTTVNDWGIPIDHPDFPGQVVNPWAEVMPQLLYAYRRALESQAARADRPKVVNFFGFDNSFFYSIVHAALLIASGDDAWLPHAVINNEFYNLEHKKFSTSNQHVLWARDLLDRHTADVIRFYGAFNTPGFEKSNFREVEMAEVAANELIKPWHDVVDSYDTLLHASARRSSAVSPTALDLGRRGCERIGSSCTLERFHLRQAAEDVVHFLCLIRTALQSGEFTAADVAYLLKCFAQAAYPIMPFAGEELYQVLADRPLGQLDLTEEIRVVAVPRELFEIGSIQQQRSAA